MRFIISESINAKPKNKKAVGFPQLLFGFAKHHKVASVVAPPSPFWCSRKNVSPVSAEHTSEITGMVTSPVFTLWEQAPVSKP